MYIHWQIKNTWWWLLIRTDPIMSFPLFMKQFRKIYQECVLSMKGILLLQLTLITFFKGSIECLRSMGFQYASNFFSLNSLGDNNSNAFFYEKQTNTNERHSFKRNLLFWKRWLRGKYDQCEWGTKWSHLMIEGHSENVELYDLTCIGVFPRLRHVTDH